ncbi:MAG: PIG-L deacetylase family protein [Thermoguttaceae bacterium]
MLPLAIENLTSVLCIGAHADDIEIGCGGTLLTLLEACPGLSVTWVVFGAGGERADEARRSALRYLGSDAEGRILVKGFRDSYFPYLGSRPKEFMEEIRDSISPDLVFTHYRRDLHQDHRLLAELTWCAFRDHLVLEYEIAKYDGDLGRPNCYFPLEESLCRRKIEWLLESFPSQRSKAWFTDDAFWGLLRLRGVECHSSTRFAEAFHAAKLVLARPAR